MDIRQFDWRDLPILLKYRHRGIFFDYASVLTRGEILVPTRAMLSYFASTIGVYTYLGRPENKDDEERPKGGVGADLSMLMPMGAEPMAVNVDLVSMGVRLDPLAPPESVTQSPQCVGDASKMKGR